MQGLSTMFKRPPARRAPRSVTCNPDPQTGKNRHSGCALGHYVCGCVYCLVTGEVTVPCSEAHSNG